MTRKRSAARDLLRIPDEGERVFYCEYDPKASRTKTWADVWQLDSSFAGSRGALGYRGPYASLDEALAELRLLEVTPFLKKLESTILSSAQIAARLDCSQFTERHHGLHITINQEDWYFTESGEFRPTGPEIVAALLAVLCGRADGDRIKALYALGEIGPAARAALPVLEELLIDEAPAIRRLAEVTLPKIGGAVE